MDFSRMDEGREEDGSDFHFYYNREERIAHAPKIVQDYYNGNGPKVHKGLFKWLVATPFSRVILIMLVAFVVLSFILFKSVPDSWEKDVGKVTATLSSFSYIDKVYASVSCAPTPVTVYEKKGLRRIKTLQIPEPEKSANGEILVVPVEVTFRALDEEGNEISKNKVVEPYSGKEMALRTEFTDYDIVSVSAEITLGGETKTLTRKVEKH